jgi:uncharacterized protein
MPEKSFEIIIENPAAFNTKTTFITGFHGLGAVGYIAIKHIIDELKLERVGVLKSSAAPPFISLTEDGCLALAFEFYGTSDHRLLFFFPRLPPYRHSEAEFSDQLAEWVIEQRFEQAILIGGVDKRLREEKDTISLVRYIPTRTYSSFLHKSDQLNILNNLLTPGLFVQGPLAVMLGILDLKKFSALGILAYAERERPDPEGAAHAIQILNKLLNINCSVEELVKNALLIEKEMNQLPSQQLDETEKNPPETYT